MTCAHFEREGLARLEAGRPDPHVDGCAECQAARATYRRLTDALADVGADLRPRAGWEDEVVAKVRAAQVAQAGQASPAPRRRRHPGRWWLATGVGAALAAAVVVLLLRPRPTPELQASVTRIRGGAIVRGDGEAWIAGDAIGARSPVAGGAVWIYRGDRPVLLCDAASMAPPTCVRDGAGVKVVDFTVSYGTYDVIAFGQAAPGPAPADADGARALLVDPKVRRATTHFDVR